MLPEGVDRRLIPALTNSVDQKFGYNGKEYEKAFKLDMLEMDFRQYDPSLGRFFTIDANGEISGAEASVDAFFGVVGFFGPFGAGISLGYFVGKAAYEYYRGETLFEKPKQY